MASSYALPASAMTHGHSHHGHTHLHSHSHSHSPSRPYSANTPRLKTELSNGSLHSHSQSESHSETDRAHSHNHSHSHGQYLERERSPSPYRPVPPNGNVLPTIDSFQKQAYQSSSALSQPGVYEPPSNAVNTVSHDHAHHGHSHRHTPSAQPRSRFTNFLLPFVLPWPLLHTILAEKDSRRIFYFMSLNFAFMLVQAMYGFLTDSLGLLSDSIHMFFDCLALGVGLFAAVASKWPPSERFPYGFGKIESLSGFGNGVFLMLISIEIMIEATERLAEGRETKRLLELFVVSGLGLAVNLVGMACFGHHGHAGHDHSHGHSHSHSHSDEKSHSHNEGHHHNDHCHDHGHGHDHHNSPLLSDSKPSNSHSHSHDNENMHGIFLHVLADTMGSAAVMLSTALIYIFGWNGFDPLASCVIAILIFMSSIPLIKSCANKLLLTIPDQIEYNLREALAGVSDIRGVGTYTVPRFWLGEKNSDREDEQVLGVMHIIATRGSDLDDVRERTRDFLLNNGVDVVVQVEGFSDSGCWCSGTGPSRGSDSASSPAPSFLGSPKKGQGPLKSSLY